MNYLYWHELPRGGFVAVELVTEASVNGGWFEGRVVVERRANAARRLWHAGRPVIATAAAATLGGLLDKLLPAAERVQGTALRAG